MKKRLDIELVDRGLAASREKAKALVMAGLVRLNGETAHKPGDQVNAGDRITVTPPKNRYVSRGGIKLEKALNDFEITLNGLVCCDFGASTGGFTDCMLQNNAKLVYAFDVGYGQFAWELRQNKKVIVFERVNVRHLRAADYNLPPIDFVCADLSFISLGLIFPVIYDVLRDEGEAVCLVKPQFEAGKELVGKRGVVKSPQIHKDVLKTILMKAKENGLNCIGLNYSPIRGPRGNIEYLTHLSKKLYLDLDSVMVDVDSVVDNAHLSRKVNTLSDNLSCNT
jgi:23S rRNA (cytidine1920-2'-O)/16S rRNA (cytidine1409-2'-O)-methyltransferase